MGELKSVKPSALQRSAERVKAPDEQERERERADWLDEFARTVGRNILNSLAEEFGRTKQGAGGIKGTTRVFTGREIAELLRGAAERL